MAGIEPNRGAAWSIYVAAPLALRKRFCRQAYLRALQRAIAGEFHVDGIHADEWQAPARSQRLSRSK